MTLIDFARLKAELVPGDVVVVFAEPACTAGWTRHLLSGVTLWVRVWGNNDNTVLDPPFWRFELTDSDHD